MQFSLSLTTKDKFRTKARQIGLNEVDRIRQETNLPKLSLSVIEPMTRPIDLRWVIEVPITEAQARMSKKFQNSNDLDVVIEQETFAKYIKEKVETRLESDGRVSKAWIEEFFDKKKFLEDWMQEICDEEEYDEDE